VSSVHVRDIRFGSKTRLVLKNNQTVVPLDNGFRFRPSGDEGPAGWWCGVVYPFGPGKHEENTIGHVRCWGGQVADEISPGEVAEIHGAVIVE